MAIANSNSQSRILTSLPEQVQVAILNYGYEAGLSPHSVILFTIARFLELDTIQLDDRPTITDDTSLLADLPLSLQTKAKQYADETEVPPEFVIELSIAHFLDPDSVTFDDCRIRVQQGLIELLKQYAKDQEATAA